MSTKEDKLMQLPKMRRQADPAYLRLNLRFGSHEAHYNYLAISKGMQT